MKDYRYKIYENYETKFNRIIDNVDEKSIKSLYQHYKKKILPFLRDYNYQSNILELGCGPGYLINSLKQNGYRNVVGIDISKEQIAIAESKGYKVFHADVFEFLRIEATSFEIIFALDFIEHFSKDELIEMLKLIYENLSDGGILVLRTPNGEGLFPNRIIYGDLTHQTIFNQNSLAQLLNYTGFDEFSFIENSPVPKNVKGIIRTILWQIIKRPLNFVKIVETGAAQKLWTQDFICVVKKNYKK